MNGMGIVIAEGSSFHMILSGINHINLLLKQLKKLSFPMHRLVSRRLNVFLLGSENCGLNQANLELLRPAAAYQIHGWLAGLFLP